MPQYSGRDFRPYKTLLLNIKIDLLRDSFRSLIIDILVAQAGRSYISKVIVTGDKAGLV